MSVRFTTDAEVIGVRYTLISSSIDMWHMPSTGVSGADLYAFDPSPGAGVWRWVGTCHVQAAAKGAMPTVGSTFTFPHARRPAGFAGQVRYKLHLPTYNGVEDDFMIGASSAIARDDAGRPAPRPIVWYCSTVV